MGRTTIGIAVASLAAGISASASAGVVPPNFQIGFADGFNSFMGPAQQWGSFTRVGTTDMWRATGSMYSQPTSSTLTWHMTVDPDPFINGTFTVSNDSNEARDYVVDFVLPISPAIPQGSYIAGSVSGTVTDVNGNGSAWLTSTGATSIYNSFIDGSSVRTMLSGASYSVGTAFGSTSFGPTTFGYPVGSVTGPAAFQSIALQFRFSLSAGDSASFSSVFVVNPIPAPGALALLGLAATIGRRRRR